jgi:hypothetical protein
VRERHAIGTAKASTYKHFTLLLLLLAVAFSLSLQNEHEKEWGREGGFFAVEKREKSSIQMQLKKKKIGGSREKNYF